MNDGERILEGLAVPEVILQTISERGGMEGLLHSIPGDEELQKEAEVHKALSDPIRLRIMHALEHTELCPCILKEVAAVTDSRLSYHLSKLEESGLIGFDREKNWRLYRLTEVGREVIGRP
ncbi:MAG: ArsR/SmtB family transcription factor [Candidatus Methanomethylophilaceae archaeon]|jgi:ArsR family transcriptional regulator